mgnify:CR=1
MPLLPVIIIIIRAVRPCCPPITKTASAFGQEVYRPGVNDILLAGVPTRRDADMLPRLQGKHLIPGRYLPAGNRILKDALQKTQASR